MLVLAACGGASGSGSAPTATNRSQSASLVAFAACMRSHGVPSFPDPTTGPEGPNSFGIDGYIFNLPANLDTQSPAYETANQNCQKLIQNAGGGFHPLPEKAREAAFAHARCMRAQGVPNFPDPVVSTSDGGISVRSGGPGMNPQSPAFQHAQKVCQPRP